jgi:hypothetical protein
LLFYIIFIIFSFKIAKKSNYRYFVFILCIANYYLNEFFSLARGYGMSAACMLAAFYYFDILRNEIDNKQLLHKFLFWCSLASLANGIALYTIFCALAILVFKYRKNIVKLSTIGYFLVFLFSGLYVIIMSRPGQSLASTGSFYECLVNAVFDTFAMRSNVVSLIIFGIFLGVIITGMIKTRFKNDYCLMYILFIAIAFLGNIAFHRGYPLSREMIPFYPLVIFIVVDVLGGFKPNIKMRIVLAVFSVLLCTQFILQIDILHTQDWHNAANIRDAVFKYALENSIGERGDLEGLVDEFGVTGRFYVEKIGTLY